MFFCAPTSFPVAVGEARRSAGARGIPLRELEVRLGSVKIEA
jgi:hypothetical protein